MRASAILTLLAATGVVAGSQQSAPDTKLLAQLKQLFPSATTFSAKSGEPPHYKIFTADSKGGQILTGLAFWTTELEPLERGFDGPIKVLVGMDTKGVLAGVIVTENHEPYGSWSVEPPEFAAQFRGKNIRDPFKVGGDIDAVSRATMSISSATRAVRNSSRRVARQLLQPPTP